MGSNLPLVRLQKPISHAAKEEHKNGGPLPFKEPNVIVITETLGLGKPSGSVREIGGDAGTQKR